MTRKMTGNMIRKLAACAVFLMLALMCAPAVFAQNGSSTAFAFVAIDNNGIIAGPEMIAFEEGQTVKDALLESGHDFGDFGSSDWIAEIDGHADNYRVFYDGNQSSFSAAASSINKALVITVRSNYSENYLELVRLLAEHESKPEAMRMNADVRSAYEAALAGLPTATSAKAAELKNGLQAAYDSYELWESETSVNVSFDIRQGAAAASGASVTVTDASGNVQESTASQPAFQLRSGTYTFRAVKGMDETEGSFTVIRGENSKTVTADLPEGRWFGDITLIAPSGSMYAGSAVSDSETAAFVSDNVISPKINIKPGASLSGMSASQLSEYYLYAEYEGFNSGTDYSREITANRIPWDSTAKALTQVTPAGLEDRSITLKAVKKDAATGFVQRQRHVLDIVRMPTLKSLSVSDASEDIDLSPEFSSSVNEYSLTTAADSLTVSGSTYQYTASTSLTNCGRYADGYSISINGQAQEEDGSCQVSIANGDRITVRAEGRNGQNSEYVINVNKVQPKTVIVNKEDGVSVVLQKPNGSEIQPVSETGTTATFRVTAGEYSWISTIDGDYHAKGSVNAGSSTGNTVTVTAATPVKEKLVESIAAFSSRGTAGIEYVLNDGSGFDWENHSCTFTVSDFTTQFYMAATKADPAVTLTRKAFRKSGSSDINKEAVLADGERTLQNGLIANGGRNNSTVVTASKTAGSITYYQDYRISTVRTATLESLKVTDAADRACNIYQNGSREDIGFDPDITQYTMNIDENAEYINLEFAFSCPGMDNDSTGGYTVSIGDRQFTRRDGGQTEKLQYELAGSGRQVEIEILTASEFSENVRQIYRITVSKVPAVEAVFVTDPQDALVRVTNVSTGEREWPDEDGRFILMSGALYRYTATAYGYIGEEKEFSLESSGDASAEPETITVNLIKAKQNSGLDPDMQSEWPYFRADENNNGVVNTQLPKEPENAALYWATLIGDGYDSEATGCPILADGYLYTYAGEKIIKMDPMTGKVIASGTMDRSSSFAINSPTYAEGMVFVGLSNGGIQAFNATTLDSLWIYNDELGGQPNCPITYRNGYIYTGFWNSETKAANFVCVSVTDEDPAKKDEIKLATWTHTGAGYYWAGAYAADDYVLVGSDDGNAGSIYANGVLLSIDPATGAVIDSLQDELAGEYCTGDIRSSVCYDEESGKYYFTTKGGYFCSVAVNENGTFDRDSVTALRLDNGGDATHPPMSTSTPVIFKGRAYIGVSGTGQFTADSGHNITVIDLSGSAPVIAYKYETKGYPQTSGLLTTAYSEEGNDYEVYVYFFENYTPGRLKVLVDSQGQTEAKGYDVFTPYGDQAQYAICSPVSDEWGNIYFKNDSAYMMMIGSVIKELTVTKKPSKLTYSAGEKFDPAGMKVTAAYANGKERDVTKYVNFTKEPLTVDDEEIDIIFDLGENMEMYQDRAGEAGQKYITPRTSVGIRVNRLQAGSVTLSKTAYTYNGKAQKPAVKALDKKGNKIAASEYTVKYSGKSVNVGAYTAEVKFRNNYQGSRTLKYRINPKGTSLSKLTGKKKAITVKWKKQSAKMAASRITGYQIQCSTSKTFKSGNLKKDVKGYSKTLKKIGNLKAGKKYYVRIRTYKTVKGTRYYSTWSSIRSVKTK